MIPATPNKPRYDQLRAFLAGEADQPGRIPQGPKWGAVRDYVANLANPLGFSGNVPGGQRYQQLRDYLQGFGSSPGNIPQGPKWQDLRNFLARQTVGEVPTPGGPAAPGLPGLGSLTIPVPQNQQMFPAGSMMNQAMMLSGVPRETMGVPSGAASPVSPGPGLLGPGGTPTPAFPWNPGNGLL